MFTSLFLSLLGVANTKKIDKQSFPHSIAEFRKVNLGNFEQTILIRGKNTNNPIILFLHGGPGMGDLPEVRAISAKLERDFTIVAWDQRGCGRSYKKHTPNLTRKQIVADAIELISYLKKHFHKEKVFLVGHSWGTVVALDLIQAISEDIQAVIAMATLVDLSRAELLSYNYALERAKENKDLKLVKALEKIGAPQNGLYRNFAKGLVTERIILMKEGGVFYNKSHENYFKKLIFKTPEYTLRDKLRFNKGMYHSLESIWNEQFTSTNFIKSQRTIPVPIYFFHGKEDYISPLSIVEEYYRVLKAPEKKLVVFEKSGHDPRVDEPEKFVDELYICFKKSRSGVYGPGVLLETT